MATYYVSATATNGYGVGVDTYPGSKSNPFLTIAAAEAVCATGDTVYVNEGTYSQGSTSLTVNKNINLYPEPGKTVLITGTNSTAILIITPEASVTPMNIGAFTVQTTGTTTRVVTTTGSNACTVNIEGLHVLTGGSAQHLGIQSTVGNINLKRVQLSGAIGTNGGIYMSVTPGAGLNILVDGCTADVTQATATTPIISLARANSASVACGAIIRNCTVTGTVSAAAANTVTSWGIRINQIPDGIIEDNVVYSSAVAATNADSYCINVSGTDATATAHRPIIRRNKVTLYAPAGRAIGIGNNSTATNEVDDAEIYDNEVYGTLDDGSNTPHGISIGDVLRGKVYRNYVEGFAVGILLSENQDSTTGPIVFGNVVYGSTYCEIFLKGNVNATVVNNTLIHDASVLYANHGAYGMIGLATSAAHNLAATIANNNCYAITAPLRWVHGDDNQVATFRGNNYYGVAPTDVQPFHYATADYANLVAWQAVATTDKSLDPGPDFLTTYEVSNALLVEKGAPVPGNLSATSDFYGRLRKNPPTIGAVEYKAGRAA